MQADVEGPVLNSFSIRDNTLSPGDTLYIDYDASDESGIEYFEIRYTDENGDYHYAVDNINNGVAELTITDDFIAGQYSLHDLLIKDGSGIPDNSATYSDSGYLNGPGLSLIFHNFDLSSLDFSVTNNVDVAEDAVISILSTGSEDYPEILQLSGALNIETDGGLATSDLRTLYFFNQDYQINGGLLLNITDNIAGDIDYITEHPGISPPGDSVSSKPSLLVYKFDNGSVNIVNTDVYGNGNYYSEVKIIGIIIQIGTLLLLTILSGKPRILYQGLIIILKNFMKSMGDDLIIDISGPVFDEDSFNQNVYIGISKDAYNSYGPMNNLEHFRWVEAQLDPYSPFSTYSSFDEITGFITRSPSGGTMSIPAAPGNRHYDSIKQLYDDGHLTIMQPGQYNKVIPGLGSDILNEYLQIRGKFIYDMSWGELAGSPKPQYEGNYWPYVYIDQEISIDEDIEANIWVSDDNLLLVDGYPVYQYLGDESPEDWNGAYVGATTINGPMPNPHQYTSIPWEPVETFGKNLYVELGYGPLVGDTFNSAEPGVNYVFTKNTDGITMIPIDWSIEGGAWFYRDDKPIYENLSMEEVSCARYVTENK